MLNRKCPVAPQSAVELLSRPFARCPFPALRRLQEEGAVHQVETLPWYLVTQYDECLRILRNTEDFSSEFREFGESMRQVGLTPTPEVVAKMQAIGGERGSMFDVILHRDPPVHGHQRRLVNEALLTGRPGWEEMITETVSHLMEVFHAAGEIEFISAIAAPLPIAVISHILGIPEEMRQKVKQWADASTAATGRIASDDDWLRMSAAIAEQRGFFASELRKRIDSPADDLISLFAQDVRRQGQDGQQALTFDEAVEILVLLLVAGNETTTQLMGAAALYLATEKGLLERLRGDAALISTFVEETLRLTAPIQTMMRFVINDTEIAGVAIPKGSLVSVCFNQASRDRAKFGDDTDSLNLDRSNLRHHLAFSSGIHTCPGARLARLETRILLEHLVKTVGRMWISGDDAVEYNMASLGVRGMTRLSLQYERLSR